MFDPYKIRSDFPMFSGKNGDRLVYLDNGATTFKPQSVIDAVTGYYRDYTANSHRGDYSLAVAVDEAFEGTRNKVAGFIGCKPEEVVFTYGTTAALNTVAFGYGGSHLKKGDVILSSLAEHASNALPWFKVCQMTGATMRYVDLDESGRITVENFAKAMDDDVKVVALAAVSNVLGYQVPIKEITAIAHRYGAVVVVDGAQSVPHLKTDVRDLDADFLAFSSHKMCGPTGIGVLYGKADLLAQTEPLTMGGGSNVRFSSDCSYLLKSGPARFEAGTQPIEAVIGMGAAIDYLQKTGMENIHEHELQLNGYMQEKLRQLDNVILYNDNSDSGICTFNIRGIFAQDAAGYLATLGICVRSGNHCAKMLPEFLNTPATLRSVVYLYNTREDVDALVKAVSETTLEKCVGIIF